MKSGSRLAIVPSQELLDQFLKRTLKTHPCWTWTGSTVRGYGVFVVDGHSLSAHRVAYALFIGSIPEDKDVLHRCDRGALGCVDPNHLFLGTQTDNNFDSYFKRRSKRKLTDEQIIAIREDPRPHSEIAQDFDIAYGTVGKIRRGVHWKHLGGIQQAKPKKLTPKQISVIRLDARPCRVIAREYAVSGTLVSLIKRELTYKEVA